MSTLEKIFHAEYLLLCIILIAVAAIYYPGLDSRFILDDTYNLGGLSAVKTHGYLSYVFSGIAGPSDPPLYPVKRHETKLS